MSNWALVLRRSLYETAIAQSSIEVMEVRAIGPHRQ